MCYLCYELQTFTKFKAYSEENKILINSVCKNQFSGVTIVPSLVAQMAKHLPTMRETWVRSLDREDPLEKEMATHSSTVAWKIPWEEPGRLQSMGSQRVRHN